MWVHACACLNGMFQCINRLQDISIHSLLPTIEQKHWLITFFEVIQHVFHWYSGVLVETVFLTYVDLNTIVV